MYDNDHYQHLQLHRHVSIIIRHRHARGSFGRRTVISPAETPMFLSDLVCVKKMGLTVLFAFIAIRDRLAALSCLSGRLAVNGRYAAVDRVLAGLADRRLGAGPSYQICSCYIRYTLCLVAQ
jgi:hypothetical protein